MLLDQFGQEIKKSAVMTDEVATIQKDIDVFCGWINRLENPDPVLRSEAMGKGLKLYDEVERDAHAGSVLQQRIMAIVGKEWEITPATSAKSKGRPASTTKEQVVADYVAEVLMNCNFDQARQELLKAILYGFYNAEIMWKVANGNVIAIKKLIGKHPRRFIFTPDRELRLLTLQNMIDGEVLPERKFITFTYGDSDNPYGKGLGQSLWWPVWFKKHGIKFWMVFLEKFGMPTIVGKYPPGTLADKQTKLMDAIETIQTDTGIIMPDNQTVEFLEASRAGTVTHEQLCEYMDRQISKRVLGQTASTEGTPGKLGNDENQENVRQEIIEADADLLDSCLNENLIKWIVDYNFPNVAIYPKIKTYAEAKPDLTARSAIDKLLVVDIGLPVAVDYFYEAYGIPAPQEGDVLVAPAKPSSVDIPQTGKQFSNAIRFAEIDPTDAWIDHYMERLSPALQSAREGALGEIESWLRSLPEPPQIDVFTDHISNVLGNAAASGVSHELVQDTVTQIYADFRNTPGVNLAFGGPDIRAINFLAKADHFYVSSYLKNSDAQSVVRNFIQERYIEKNGGLFGRGNAADIAEFKNLLGQKAADLEGWQVRRIIDTSVQRTRNWAGVAQMHEAGIEEIEIYEPTQECAFCKEMNGQVVSVSVAYQNIERQMNMSPEEFEADMKAASQELNRIAQTTNRADVAASAGRLPPYHPGCRGRAIKRVK